MIESTYFRVPGKSIFLRNVCAGMASTLFPPLHRWARLAPALYSASAKGIGSDCVSQCSNARRKYHVPASRFVFGSNSFSTRKLSIFVGRFFAHLHEPALSGGAVFFGIKAAFAPDDRFDQHWIEMMLHRDRANQAIVLFESGRAHPFVECVDGVARSHGQIGEARGQREQYTQDQFEDKSYHFGIKSRAPARASN